ncbi:MAG: hypothetical protein Q9215_007647 [Flavoplaca cf. flavocitrina]
MAQRSEGAERMIEEQMGQELGGAQVTTIDQQFGGIVVVDNGALSSFSRESEVWSQRISDQEAEDEEDCRPHIGDYAAHDREGTDDDNRVVPSCWDIVAEVLPCQQEASMPFASPNVVAPTLD